jgi:hypothetical protein
MSNGGTLPLVDRDEWLARFILYKRYIRADGTVRPDAFIPHPYPDLSVTRHLQLSEAQLWELGRDVGQESDKILQGRADIQASAFQRHELHVVPAALPKNPNHANVTGWPAEKPAQKIIAQQIAAAAGKAPTPPPNMS